MSTDLVIPALVIRPPRDSEARACRILLPAMFSAHQAPDVLVALGPGGAILGAIGLGTVHGPEPGFPLLVEIVRSHRRQGHGRALVAAAIDRVRSRTPVLRALHPVPVGSPAEAFLLACGFRDHDTIHHFEADARAFHATMLAIRQRLQRRIPPGASVIRLGQAPRLPAAALLARTLAIPLEVSLARLRPGAENGFDLHHSGALMLDGTLRGVLAYRWNDGLPVIKARVIDEALRGGWANALLLERSTAHAVETGATRFRFFADGRIADTLSLARRAGAAETLVERLYRRAV